MRLARWIVRVGLTALGAAIVTTCKISDVLTTPGVGNVALSYGGATVLVLGATAPASASATVDGGPLPRAQFEFSSSDSSIVAVRGDTLVARARGSATLTVRLSSSVLPDEPPSISQQIDVVVDTVTLDSASVLFTSVGDTVTLAATSLDADGNSVSGAGPAWATSDTAVVAVTSTGRLAAKRNGTATVKAKVDRDSALVTVTVQQVLDHYTFEPASLRVDALAATALSVATGRDARNNSMTGVPPTWTIGDASIALLSATTGVVTTLINGETYLYATRGSVTDSVLLVVVQKATLVFVTPDPVPALTSISDQVQLTGRAFDRRGIELQGAAPAWFTLDPVRLRVSSEGLVTALADGLGRVIATLDGAVDTVNVNVSNDPAVIEVTPDTASATSLGDTIQFSATVRNGRDDPIATAVVAWRSANPGVAAVLADGRAIALSAGTARVIASIAGKADTGILRVTNLPAVLDIGPDNRTLNAIGVVDTPAVTIQNARGVPLARGSVTWTADDATIVRVSGQGFLTARDTGQTYVHASGGLLSDSVLVTVTNNPASIVIAGRAVDTLTALGQALTFTTTVRNARNDLIANYPVQWRSVNQTVVDTVQSDNVATAIGFGTTFLIAQGAGVADTMVFVVRNPTRLFVDNSVVANPRVGTLARPYSKIQDAVDAADANDTVIVRRGASAYSETVALSRRISLLGDSTDFASVAGGRNPGLLPVIGHDSGAAGITAYTTAPETIRYFSLVHTLDGPAIDGDGSDMTIEYFYVNRATSVTSRIGRGISLLNSTSGSRVLRSAIDSVRGYGIRLESVSNATVDGNLIRGVDSLVGGVEEGAGIKLLTGSGNTVIRNLVKNAQIGVLVTGSTTARVDTNFVLRNTVGMRLDAGDITSATINDIYDNDSAGVANPLAGVLTITGNWWGDDRGPRRNENTAAAGDSAVGNINFSLFRSSPARPGSAPTGVRRVRGNLQSASGGGTLSRPFTVRVTDVTGLPVSDVSVTFTVTFGGGDFAGATSVTAVSNSSGIAEPASFFTLGPSLGGNTVTVTGTTAALGSVTFTANGT